MESRLSLKRGQRDEMDPRGSSPPGPAGDDDSGVGRRLREEGSGAAERALCRSERETFCRRRSSLRLRLIPFDEAVRDREKKTHLRLSTRFSLSSFSLSIPQQMVEVEAFSSVHDMIQAALDKHGGTATLREVSLGEEGEREMGCFFVFS